MILMGRVLGKVLCLVPVIIKYAFILSRKCDFYCKENVEIVKILPKICSKTHLLTLFSITFVVVSTQVFSKVVNINDMLFSFQIMFKKYGKKIKKKHRNR